MDWHNVIFEVVAFLANYGGTPDALSELAEILAG
jgi:hypothetical protein